jgi:hypothetical protein
LRCSSPLVRDRARGCPSARGSRRLRSGDLPSPTRRASQPARSQRASSSASAAKTAKVSGRTSLRSHASRAWTATCRSYRALDAVAHAASCGARMEVHRRRLFRNCPRRGSSSVGTADRRARHRATIQPPVRAPGASCVSPCPPQ